MNNNLIYSTFQESADINFWNFNSKINSLNLILIGLILLITTYICTASLLSIETIQNIIISADQLTIPSLARDILSNPMFSLHTWMLPRAPYIFPDLPMVLALKVIIHNDAWIVIVQMFLHIVLTIFLSYLLLLRSAIYSVSAIRSVCIFSILCALLCTEIGSYWSFILTAAPFQSISHATSLDMAVFSVLWFESIKKKNKFLYIYLISFTLITGTFILSDKIFFLIFSIPYFLSLVIFPTHIGRYIDSIAFFFSQTIAFVGAYIIQQFFLFQGSPSIQLMQFGNHFILFVNAILRQNTAMAVYYAIGIGLISFMLGRAIFQRFHNFTIAYPAPLRLQTFIAISGAIGLIFCISLWEVDTDGFGRYGISFQLGVLWSAALLLTELWPLRAQNLIKYTIGFLIMLAGASVLSGRTSNPFGVVKQQALLGSELRACAKREGLLAGFAGYSWARKLSSATDWNVQVDQMEPNHSSPFFWGNNFLWFYTNLSTGQPIHHNFIVENDIGEDAIADMYGQPSRRVECGMLNILVYNDSNALDRNFSYQLNRTSFVENLKYHTPDWVQKEILFPEADLPFSSFSHQIGKKNKNKFSVSEPSPPGVLIYGPYITLPSGKYRLQREYACSNNKTAIMFDVTGSGGENQIDKHVIEPNGSECDGLTHIISEEFTLEKKSEAIEFRVIYGGSGTLEVDKIHLAVLP